MLSGSIASVAIKVTFIGDGQEIYGSTGLIPSTERAVGVDLRACLPVGERICVPAGGRYQFATGIAIEPVVAGIAGFVYSRSGLGARVGLTVAQGVGIIDPDYRGEIFVYMYNTSSEDQVVERGDRIAQLVMQPYYYPIFMPVSTLSETARASGGFGHTGMK